MEDVGFFDNFMPHGMCYLWYPNILLMHVISDAVIAIAYFFIPCALGYFFWNKSDFPFRKVILMFSVFIFTCGLSHIISIWTVWSGVYGVHGLVKAATATASLATAVMLIPVMPQLMALRSPKELEVANTSLRHEIEERSRLEQQTLDLEQQVAHVDRLDTMGQMAAGLAHEINQPLMALAQNADSALLLGRRDPSVDPEMIEILDDIVSQAHRAGEIIRALRLYVGNDQSSRTEFDLADLLQQALRLVENDAKQGTVDIQVIMKGPVVVFGDRVQVAQVFVNLLRNSIEAMAGTDLDRKQILISAVTKDTGTVIAVTDNGPGFLVSEEVFTPFQSKKHDGMGVGLSICRSIVESHGGSFVIDPKRGAGARVEFTLPHSGDNG